MSRPKYGMTYRKIMLPRFEILRYHVEKALMGVEARIRPRVRGLYVGRSRTPFCGG